MKAILTKVKGPQVDVADDKGLTPMAVAFITGHGDLVPALIKAGADVNKPDAEGVCCIHRAAGHGDIAAVKALAAAGADLNLQSSSGTPLHWAAGEGSTTAVVSLLELGARPDMPNSDGVTPIIMAAARGAGECVASLAKAGADCSKALHDGLTVLHIACDMGLCSAVEAMLNTEEGRSLAKKPSTVGFKPIELAAMSGKRELVEMLLPHCDVNVRNTEGTQEAVVDSLMATGREMAEKYHNGQPGAAANESNETATGQQFDLESTDAAVSPEAAEAAIAEKDEGNRCLKEKDIDGAIEHYSRAIKLNGADRVYWSNRCLAYMQQEDYTRALADAEVCRKLSPDWPKGCYRLAQARLAVGRYEDAAIAAWEGVQLDNSNDDLKNLLNRCIKLGRKEEIQKRERQQR
ncbi:unnamed protein product [Chrysoparadoxa australica]